MPKPLNFQQLKQTGNKPTARSGHTITTVGKNHVMFGGLDSTHRKNDKLCPNNEVYSLKLTAVACEWKIQTCQGDIPLPRTNHAACAIGNDKLFIFGGYYTSNLRFNDVYILKLPEFHWKEPPNQKSGSEPKNTESKIGAPEPRANHSCNYHGGKVYVFGGHGGTGYQRTSFNDMYVFDCETFEWTKMKDVSGSPPLPRGGHTAAILSEEDKIIIYGGWSQTTQHSDVQIYDIKNNSWIDPELSHDTPRWGHAGMMVTAIPSWKYFIFGGSVGNFEEGGNRTISQLNDQSYVLDMMSMKWQQIQLEDLYDVKGVLVQKAAQNKPKARENSAMFFDSNESRLIIFGGWANNWLTDMVALNVSSITGPPYAIYSIKPALGPLTGKTRVVIIGEGFRDTPNIQVQFQCAKGQPEAAGNYISNTEIWCETPSFEAYGPRNSEVILKIGNGDYTITSTNFVYFLNTEATNTIAYGPGLLKQNCAGYKSIFSIQARNTKGENRESGADNFQVKIIHKNKKVMVQKTREIENFEGQIELQQYQEEEIQNVEVEHNLIDKEDGTYDIEYQINEDAEEVEIQVKYQNPQGEYENIRGTPFKSSWKKGLNPKNNEMQGNLMNHHISNTLAEIENFISENSKEINIKNKNLQDVMELLKVKGCLSQIQEQKLQTMLNLDVIDEILNCYSKQGSVKENDSKKVKKLKQDFNQLQSMSNTVEKEIQTQVKSEGDKAKDNLQKFDEKLKEFQNNLKKEEFYKYQNGGAESQKAIQAVLEKVKDLEDQMEKYSYFAQMFNFKEDLDSPQQNLTKIKKELDIVNILWTKIIECQKVFEDYQSLTFLTFDCVEKDDEVKQMRKQLTDLKGLDKKMNVFIGIMEDIKKWAAFLPLCGEMRDPAMDTADGRHWANIKRLVQKDFVIDEKLKIKEVWEMQLFKFKDDVEDITDQAKQELKMEKAIAKIIEKWKEVEFESIKHKDTNIFTLKMQDEHFEQLEEHQNQINNMLLSKYIKFFEKEVEQWKLDLGAIYDVVTLIGDVQKTWSFLENLFIQSEEVKKELPNESEKFVTIDKNMKFIMDNGNKIKNVLKFCTQPTILKDLEEIEKQLKVCEQALNEFLDGKRRSFPRFYFVSQADLLDILSNGNSPEKINKHMSKIFQAVDHMELEPDGERPKAKAMISGVGKEKVEFTAPMKLQGKVENYLADLINLMRSTLNQITQKSVVASQNMKREDWLKIDPAQVTILVNMMSWSRNIELCFDKMNIEGDLDALKKYQTESNNHLTGLIKMVQGKLDSSLRQKVMVLITMDTHSRDVNDRLITETVRKAEEFQWQSQLKSYFEQDTTQNPKAIYAQFKSDARINICDAVFYYSYEYLGNGPRLVITPLTDRIYVTATQALHLKMGCAPAGPAGTGKTESTKDLSNAVSKACYVFNCSGEMNYESMGNIFKGLASSGCWGCFDEFNRLYPEVLSVCSVQFKAVCDATKTKKKGDYFMIEGDSIVLDPTCGAFITMNPGYLGRSELPEGLKALFRPITVVVPQFEQICENMLMAEGFVEAKILARKFVTLFTLCRDLLSKSKHYDWGLRAIKSVLNVAGAFKRSDTHLSEEALLMRALRDFNLPKIIAADLPIFFGLLGDLFPRITVERKRDMDFEKCIEKTCVSNEMKLYPEPQFILKVVQLKELMEIRWCVFIMGPPGSGKTKTWQCLQKSSDNYGQKTLVTDMNPKVVSTKDLYGYTLPSKEWKDGLLSKLMRGYAEIPDTNAKWIVLDGDLDANWIESMNSVMDDNRILTLANNERIPLKTHMRLIFEIRNLNYATPATVSRAGILYISDDDGYQWKSYIKSWILEQQYNNIINVEERKLFKVNLQNLFDKYIAITLKQLHMHFKFVIPVVYIQMVVSLCKQLQTLLNHEAIFKCLEYVFVYALVWAVGGVLCEKDGIDYKKEFSSWWKSEQKSSVKFPSKGTVFDYYVEIAPDGSAKFNEWTAKLKQIEFDSSNMIMSNVTVPTRETVSTSEFIKKYLTVQHPVLLIGNSGCGKTALALGILREIVAQSALPNAIDQYAYQVINFNNYTDSAYLQTMLEQQLVKKAGKQYGPSGKIKLIYFIDDLNMPQDDGLGTQTAIALLRQAVDAQHWYDIQKLQIKEITNTQHFASMNPSAGSFYVNPRYQRNFWITNVAFPDNESLFQIFNTFLSGHLKTFRSNVQEQCSVIIKAALQLHTQIVSSFRKTAINFHYEFNIRHLSNIFQGLLLTQPAQFQEPEKIIKLWIHESERSYCDRLVTYENIAQYKNLAFDIIKKNFNKFNFNKYFQKDNPENLIFCNFTQGISGEKWYDIMVGDNLKLHINDALKEYNDNNAQMDLVLFEDAMKHVCKITRIMIPSQGHALLVGVGGSGKQSLSKLASYIMQFTTYSITISSTYSMTDLKVDIQSLYNKTGIRQEPIMFLFTEGQIANERFLVYINDLLSSGEIADLYTNDEKEVIINQLRTKCKAEKGSDNRDTVWNFFIEKVKQNLHMSLCFSPVGESFRRRARQFPALVNCTTIDWFQDWPYEALLSVADNFLKEIELNDEVIRPQLVEFMPYSFKIVNDLCRQLKEKERRSVFTTPKSFLELIQLYKTMLESKRRQLEEAKERYEQGLIKLISTSEQVAKIEEDVKIKQAEAEEKKKQSDIQEEIVGKEKKTVQAESDKANIEAEKCAVIKANVEAIKFSAEQTLEQAGPLVEQAKEALNSLNKGDFSQVKSFANPPKGIPEVFQACQLIMAGFWNDAIEVDKNKKPKVNTWKDCLKMMKNPDDLLKRLIDFKEIVDLNQAIASNIVIVKSVYLSDPEFTPEVLIKKSTAATGICKWVINIIKYWDVIQQVEPTRQKLKEASEQLEVANTKKAEVDAIVAELNASLRKLEAEYDQAISEKNAAMDEAARCERRLNLAQRLVKALGSENERWANKIKELEEQLEVLVGDSLLASAFISYAGPFAKQYREIMIQKMFIPYITNNKIPMTKNINPIKLLTDEATIALWNQQGLPDDPVSVENGTILTSSQRYPLIIDPQLQGITWIREKEKNFNLKQVRLGSKNIVREIEMSIENGYSALIENMGEQIDAIFMPVICRATIKRGNKKILKFGGKDLQLHKDFKLFMQTKLSNPHYPPEIQAETTMINFTVTEDGLCDQLLTLVVSRERPDLSKMKIQMIKQQNDYKIKLKDLETDLLYRLASAQGDILENIELIENLEKSKQISIEVSRKVAIIQVTEVKINETSENYRPAASRGALIYFLMTDLAKIHQFYKYSLESFIAVMNRAIDSITEKKEEVVVEKKEGEEQEQLEQNQEQQNQEDDQQQQSQQQESKEVVEAKEENEQGDGDDVIAESMSPRSLQKRVNNLIDSITITSFNYTRRGLLEKHKLIVTTMLTLRILLKKGVLLHQEVEHLTLGKFHPNPPPMPDVIKGFVTEQMWANCKALEDLQSGAFNNFGQSLEQDNLQWKKWYNDEKAEEADLPKAFKEISKFHKLLLLRAMRPDRLTYALSAFILESMGEVYVEQSVLDIDATYKESSAITPIFFVLFPGVEPSGELNFIATKYGFTNKFLTISMGQGQEKRAERSLLDAAKNGTWICLENLHLMQNWLYGINGLEGILEQAFEIAHPDFRAFVTSEPPNQGQEDLDIKILPESLLQQCIKVSNENPQDLKANLRRAYSKFDQKFIDRCSKPNEFKAILFALCFFHSVICGRKKFGSLGWSRGYNFNDGDLTICADVLFNYITKYDVVPYQDLKYIFGEIMYGGHITDDWDRRTNNTYLIVYIKQELLANYALAPGFRSPDPAKFNYDDYRNYIETKLPAEQPAMFGLHANAEINYLTSLCDKIFDTIMNISGKVGGGSSNENQLFNTLMDYKKRLPEEFNLNEINSRIKDKSPNVVVCLQECERMNLLLETIRNSLEDLRLGMTGALNMTDAMETLSTCLGINKVPAAWEAVAYFSKKLLASWFADLLERVKQLGEWSAKDIIAPKSLCISYLFNPMSFLTAVMQNTARKDGYPLDNMVLQTSVTQIKTPEEVQKEAPVGAYIHGLYLEGATWELGGQGQQGYLIEQKVKEIHPRVPVVLVEAVPIENKKTVGQYICPVYVTSMRGPTYVFTANLNMENEDSDPNKWVLTGTCLLMSDD